MPNDTGGIVVTRAEELNKIGHDLFGKNQMEPARLHFLAALALEPNNPRALQNLGATLRALRHFETALSVARRSVVASGNNPMARSNLGASLITLRHLDEALEVMRGVVNDVPNAVGPLHNYGLVLYCKGMYEEALNVFDRGLKLAPHNAQIQSDRALAILSLGRIQEGLAAYEARWDILKRSQVWGIGIPEWQGEPLQGLSILVHHEQGFGDSIMLVRFIRDLARRGCYITLAVPKELVRLFRRSFDFIKVFDMEEIVIVRERMFDYHSPMLSVMRHLGVTSPHEINPEPYLKSRPMAPLSLPNAKMKIGICWASGNHGVATADRRRVIPLTQFLPLTEIPGVSLVSLQKDKEGEEIIANGLEGIIFDVSHKIEDFADTAYVMAHLDLVVSVDSAVAHLAGAIGKPVLMLSPYTRCWRWWNDNGMPWYKDLMQFAQAQDGAWLEALSAVQEEIVTRVPTMV